MRSDVAHDPQLAVRFGIQTPIPVGIVEQPILRIRTLHNQNLTQVAMRDHLAHLLKSRVVAQVVLHAMQDILLLCRFDQFLGLCHVHRHRLLAQHCLAGIRSPPATSGSDRHWACRCARRRFLCRLKRHPACCVANGTPGALGKLLCRFRPAPHNSRNLHVAQTAQFSACTFPMNPVPTIAALIFFHSCPSPQESISYAQCFLSLPSAG